MAFKPKNAPKLRRIMYSLTEMHEDMIEQLLPKLGALSNSEVVRQAITNLYSKHFPAYMKSRKVPESLSPDEQSFNSQTDEEYAKEVLQSPVVYNTEGVAYILYHTIGHSLNAIPLQGCKEYMKNHPVDLELHLEILSKGTTIISQISTYMRSLLYQEFGITLPVYDTGEDTGEDKEEI